MAKYRVTARVLNSETGEYLEPGTVFESSRSAEKLLATGCFETFSGKSEAVENKEGGKEDTSATKVAAPAGGTTPVVQAAAGKPAKRGA